MKTFVQNTRWAILWGLLIFILTCIPGSVIPRIPSYLDLLQPDKLVHVGVFAVFFILLARSFVKEQTPASVARHPLLFSCLICLFAAGSTELLQEFVIPMRTASVWDFAANLSGILIGFVLVKVIGKRTMEHR